MEFKNWLTKNIGITAGISLALLILIFFLGNDISKRATEIKEKRTDLATRLYSIESLTSLQTDSEKATRLQSTIETSLPAKDQLINFSKALENFTKANKMDFGFAFESEIAGAENTPGINNFTLTTAGNYPNFLKFLNYAENSKYFVGFNSFNLEKAADKYKILIKGKVFSQ